MRFRKPLLLLAALAIIATSALFAHRYTHAPQRDNFAVLNYLPRDPDAVIYVDIAALRQSPFLAQLAAWLPPPQRDPDYLRFVAISGFDFERDLDHLAVATPTHGDPVVVAEGRFDRKKISEYALRLGTKKTQNGHDVFHVPELVGAGQPGIGGDLVNELSLSFLSDHLLIASRGNLERLFVTPNAALVATQPEWHERFERLGGSPAFAVIRQDIAASLAGRAPGGLRSEQLSSMLAQLQWITIAAKPDADQLRLVAEGESASEATQRQLADVLNGVVILAEAGLSDPKVRQQLAPDVRQACLDLLKSADISRIDRGETKSVRLVLSLTPQFLEAARRQSALLDTPNAGAQSAPNASPPRSPGKSPGTHRAASRKSGT